MQQLNKLIATIILPLALTSHAQEEISYVQGDPVISKVMTAEIALARQQPLIALENYLSAAKLSRDPLMAQQATQIALELMLDKQALESVQLWAELAKDQLDAQLVAISLLVSLKPQKTQTYIENAARISPTDLPEAIQLIYSQLPEPSKEQLLSQMVLFTQNNPNNPNGLLALAYLNIPTGNIEKVEELTNKALEIAPSLTRGIELKAKLISNSAGNDFPAITYLQEATSKYPKDSELRMFMASAMVDNKMFEEAKNNLRMLVKDQNQGGAALFLLSEINLLEGNHSSATENLLAATKFESVESKARYMLGQIYELTGKDDLAIEQYQQISDPLLHVTAYIKAADLLKSQRNYEMALEVIQAAKPQTLPEQKQILLLELDLLVSLDRLDKSLYLVNQALQVLPNDIDFLYMRSVISIQLNQLKDAETDLNTILSLNPNHANALNILGYNLSSQKERHEEALKYLERAIAIAPNNPSIMDSMGLLLYRMGQLQASLSWLEKAYSVSQESNIALHLSEVLYALGKHDKALSVLNKALNLTPDDKALVRLREKVKIQKLEKSPAK